MMRNSAPHRTAPHAYQKHLLRMGWSKVRLSRLKEGGGEGTRGPGEQDSVADCDLCQQRLTEGLLRRRVYQVRS